jgi:hypothetical protein
MIMNGTGSNQPAQNKHPLASPSVGQLAGNKVGAGLHHAEADDEGDDERRRTDSELLGADQRHDGSLDADHPCPCRKLKFGNIDDAVRQEQGSR